MREHNSVPGYNREMRYLGVLAAGLIAFVIASQAGVVTVEQIVCKLNGDIITNIDLDHDRADLEKQLRTSGYTGKKLEDAVKAEAPNLLRNKIDNLLLVQKGKELELKVDPDVNKYLADLQRQTSTADPEKFQALVRQETGKSYEDFKDDLKKNFYVQGVIREEVMRKIQFTNEEVHGSRPQRRALQRTGANQLGFPDGEGRRRAGSLQERRPGARDRSLGVG
jgi:peptidyl-prolyl cis-trans isomerase SurA